ncbi:hypothetical protein JXM83_03590 [Candidatus Woesearchaeota archaeon]|nr:hypothetical protein [Candidatus Woesearchaeota archaeon]
MDSIIEEYERLKSSYDLPEFHELDKALELDDLESPITLKDLRNKFHDRFSDCSKILETLFQPEGEFSSYIETKIFASDIKDDYFEAYKRLRYLVREAQLLSVHNDKDKDAEFVKQSHKTWQDLKPVIVDFLENLKNCWLNPAIQDNVKYFG